MTYSSPMKSNHLAPGLLLTNGLKAYEKKDYISCERFLSQYLQFAPRNMKASLILIEILRDTNRYEEAIIKSQALLDYADNDVSALQLLAQILVKANKANFKLKEFASAPLTEQGPLIFKKVLGLLKREKLISKQRNYSKISIKIITELVHDLATQKLDPKWVSEIAIFCESEEMYLNDELHLNYPELLLNQPNTLIKYVNARISHYGKSIEWLRKVHLTIKLASTKSADLSLTSLKVNVEITALTSNIDSLVSELAVAKEYFQGLSSQDLGKLIEYKSKILAQIELSRGLRLLQSMKYPLHPKDHVQIHRAYQAFKLSLSHNPTPKAYSCIQALECSLDSKFLNGLVSEDVYLEIDSELSDLNSFLVLPICENNNDAGPKSLVDTIELFLWIGASPAFDLHLKKAFPGLLPTSNAYVQDGLILSQKSATYDNAKTPTLTDIEAFLLMQVLERQLALLDNASPTTVTEFYYHQYFVWTPSKSANEFWTLLTSTSSKIKSIFSSDIQQMLKKIRGIDCDMKSVFAAIGIYYSTLPDRKNEALYYLSLAELDKEHRSSVNLQPYLEQLAQDRPIVRDSTKYSSPQALPRSPRRFGTPLSNVPSGYRKYQTNFSTPTKASLPKSPVALTPSIPSSYIESDDESIYESLNGTPYRSSALNDLPILSSNLESPFQINRKNRLQTVLSSAAEESIPESPGILVRAKLDAFDWSQIDIKLKSSAASRREKQLEVLGYTTDL